MKSLLLFVLTIASLSTAFADDAKVADVGDLRGLHVLIKKDLKISNAGNSERIGYHYSVKGQSNQGFTIQCYFMKQMPANTTKVIKAGTKYEIQGTISPGDSIGGATLMLTSTDLLSCDASRTGVVNHLNKEVVNLLFNGDLEIQ